MKLIRTNNIIASIEVGLMKMNCCSDRSWIDGKIICKEIKYETTVLNKTLSCRYTIL